MARMAKPEDHHGELIVGVVGRDALVLPQTGHAEARLHQAALFESRLHMQGSAASFRVRLLIQPLPTHHDGVDS